MRAYMTLGRHLRPAREQESNLNSSSTGINCGPVFLGILDTGINIRLSGIRTDGGVVADSGEKSVAAKRGQPCDSTEDLLSNATLCQVSTCDSNCCSHRWSTSIASAKGRRGDNGCGDSLVGRAEIKHKSRTSSHFPGVRPGTLGQRSNSTRRYCHSTGRLNLYLLRFFKTTNHH